MEAENYELLDKIREDEDAIREKVETANRLRI